MFPFKRRSKTLPCVFCVPCSSAISFPTQRDRFWVRTLDCGPETEPCAAACSCHASPWTSLSKRTSEIASAQNHWMQIRRSEILCAGILCEKYFYQYMFDIGFYQQFDDSFWIFSHSTISICFYDMTLAHLSKINVHAHLWSQHSGGKGRQISVRLGLAWST